MWQLVQVSYRRWDPSQKSVNKNRGKTLSISKKISKMTIVINWEHSRHNDISNRLPLKNEIQAYKPETPNALKPEIPN